MFESFKNVGKPSETMGKPEKTWENQKETMGKRGKTIRNMQKPWVLTKNGDSMVHFQSDWVRLNKKIVKYCVKML